MAKSVPHAASHHEDFSLLLWCLVAVMVGCWGWLFYTLYAALR